MHYGIGTWSVSLLRSRSSGTRRRTLAQDLGDGRGGGRYGLAVVLAEQRGDAGRDLRLVNLRDLTALA
jgi:hypothetical protein